MINFVKKIKFEILFVFFFVLLHVWNLGHDNFNTDVWKWKQRSYDFGTGVYGLNFAKTFQKYHPGVTLMWVGSTGVKVSNLFTQDIFAKYFNSDLSKLFLLDTIQKILLVFSIGVVLSFGFYVVHNIFGLRVAILSFVLLSLEPFYLGLTRVFHLEGIMSAFMVTSVLWLYYFFQETTQIKRLLISGIFGGLAVLTKTSALLIVPFVGFSLIYLSGLIDVRQKININEFIRPTKFGFMWLGVALITFVLVWPAMWVAPVKSIEGLYKGIADVGIESEHSQIYFGTLVEDPGTLFYLVVIGLRSTVWLFLGFICALIFISLKKLDPKRSSFIIYLASFSLVYLVEITLPSKKLDRYIIPSILTMSLASSIFIDWLVVKFDKYKYLFMSLLFGFALYTNLLVHPDYFTYYSPLFGGYAKGIYILEPKWLIGEREILAYFTKIKIERGLVDSPQESFEELIHTPSGIEKMLTVGFPEKYYTQIWPFFREINGWAVIEHLRPFAKKTRFFVYPVWANDGPYETRFKTKELGKIYIHGVHTYTVYERTDF